MKRRTADGAPLDYMPEFEFEEENGSGEGLQEEAAEQMGPFWFAPGNGTLPETGNFPPIWLDWFLGFFDDPKSTPWEPYDLAVAEGLVRPGTRLFYSSVLVGRGSSRRVGWVLIPTPPLYGAHHLAGFETAIAQLPKKNRPPIADLTSLRWVRLLSEEEAVVYNRETGQQQAVEIPGRPALQDVWPNVLCVDGKLNRLLAIPYTSNVGYGDDPEVVEGAPPYPMHLPTKSINVVDVRMRANKWRDRPYPLNDGGFWIYTIDGEMEGQPEDADYSQASLAFNLDQAATFHERARVLRRQLKLGNTTSVAILRYRAPTADVPGGYLVVSCQYPAFVLFATGFLGPKDTLTLSYSKKLIIAVLKNALPGIRALDLERRPLAKMDPPSRETTADVAAWVGFKRTVICALEDWRSGLHFEGGAGDSGDAHLRRDAPNDRRLRFQARSAGAATATQAVDLLLFDKSQARSAVLLLANGWETQFRPVYETWMDPSFRSPFDAALIHLASLLAPNEANPAFGLLPDDPRWQEEPELLLNMRQRVLERMRSGLKGSTLESLWAWEAQCRWQSPDDPGVDCTLAHWMLFLSFAMCASQLPLTSTADMRR